MNKLLLILLLFFGLECLGQAQVVPGIVASGNKMIVSEPTPPARDPDAVKFTTATGVVGSNLNAVDSLVKWLKDSSLWSYAQIIYPVIGGTAAAHAYNLRDTTTFKLIFSGGWTHSATGMKGNGSSGYAKTGWIPSSQVNAALQSSAGIYLRTNTDGTYVDMGALSTISGAPNYYQIYSLLSGNTYIQLISKNSVGQTISNSDSRGWFSSSKYEDNAFTDDTYIYVNDRFARANYTGVSWGGSVTHEVYLGAQNKDGSAMYFSPREIAFVWLSNIYMPLAKMKTLQNVVIKYETLLGRNI